MKEPMKLKLAIVYVALMAMFGAMPAWSADKAADAAKVKLQAALMSSLQSVAAAAGGDAVTDVRVTSEAHQTTATVVDGKSDKAAVSHRDASASKIVSAIASVIADKPEFSQVMVIHVNYVMGPDSKSKAIQSIDFFKSSAGVFAVHKT